MAVKGSIPFGDTFLHTNVALLKGYMLVWSLARSDTIYGLWAKKSAPQDRATRQSRRASS